MYSPFEKKHLDDLKGADLLRLVDVPEGWFVEYKEQPCKSRDYAKAVSAFANDRGGWLFIGIVQDPTKRTPQQATGVPALDAARLLDAARDAITQNLSPTPRFDLGVINGPVPELSLADDRAVLVIRVDESENTPHIHSSGRIYRRQADSSGSLEITDRAELDDLYKRSSRLRKRLDRQLDRGFDRRWAEQFDVPWVHASLVPSAVNKSDAKFLKFASFLDVVSATEAEGVALPDAYGSALGYVARNHSSQISADGPALALEYSRDDRCLYYTMPMSLGRQEHAAEADFLRTENGLHFMGVVNRLSLNGASILDGTYVVAAIMALHARGQKLLTLANVSGPYLCRLRGMNLFRRVPYFNSKTYVDWCSRRGPPVILHGEVTIPSHDKSWRRLEDVQAQYALAAPAALLVTSLGVPADIAASVVAETISNASTFRPS